MRAHLLFLLPFVPLALLGCSPDTPYRYTALTPGARPIAWDGRGSRGGTLHVEGHGTTTGFGVAAAPKSASLHETALHVSKTSLDGTLLLEPIRGLQVGVHGSYSSYDWSTISTFGTMPLPNKPSLFGVGPEVRLWLPFDKNSRFALGFAGNLLFYTIPYAEWTRTPCTPSLTCESVEVYGENGRQTTTYQLTKNEKETKVVGTAGLYPSVGLGDGARYGNVFGLLGVTQGFSNDGFTDTQSSDGKIGTYAVPILGGGYGFRHAWLHINVGLYVPINSSQAVQYNPGGWLTIGIDPPLWNGTKKIGPRTRP